MVFRPPMRLGLIVGLFIIVAILAIGAYLLVSARQQELGLGLFFTACLFAASLILLVLWVYWYVELLTLRYHLDRNALTVAWGTGRQVIPLAAIQEIVPGRELKTAQGLRGIGWPGYMKGVLPLKQGGTVITHSTELLERQIVIVTATERYGISPRDVPEFVTALNTHRALGAVRTIQQRQERATWLLWPLWRDRRLWGLVALALLLNLTLVAWIMYRYSGLPTHIPLHFDAQGLADRIVPKEWLFVIPAIGILTWSLNVLLSLLLYGREKLAAYLLGFTSLGVQVIQWLAAISILGR